MKTKDKLLKQKYRDELHDNYIRHLLRAKGLMNYQITHKMIDDKRASVILKREREEFEKWKHFEKGEEPCIGQECFIVDKNNINYCYYGEYVGGGYFAVSTLSYWIKCIAWQPAPIYKP